MRTPYDPAAGMLGGYSSTDGTVEFYGRVGALLEPEFRVLDLGAGVGRWFADEANPMRRRLRDIRPKVAEYIGADVDEAVLQNRTTTRNLVIENGIVPIESGQIDLIVCDFVLEHIDDVAAFQREVDRLLKPGGVFCARTPNRLHYVALAARLAGNARHRRWLRAVQPDRPPESVFPTRYRLNTLAHIRRAFEGWSDHSYYYPSEPQYYFGTRWGFQIFSILHKLAPRPLTGNLFVFLRKPCPQMSG